MSRQLLEERQGVTIAAAAGFVLSHLVGTGEITGHSAIRYDDLWSRFERFSRARGVLVVGDVDQKHASAFVHAKDRQGNAPGVATMHLRRGAVRLLFKVLRHFGVADRDPTQDLTLAPRTRGRLRPLTDDENVACEWASLATLTVTRQPAIWALSESGGSTGEIPEVLVERHIDLANNRVFFGGTAKLSPRWAALTSWGRLQLARRLRDLEPTGWSGSVIYEGGTPSRGGQASVISALNLIMRRAGLGSEPDLRPASVRGWRGAQILEQTGRVEDAACFLGLASLDVTADLIGYHWNRGDR